MPYDIDRQFVLRTLGGLVSINSVNPSLADDGPGEAEIASFVTRVARELGLRSRPRFGHGVEVAVDARRTLLCSYHVSQQNTFTGRLTEEMLDDVLRRARELGAARTR